MTILNIKSNPIFNKASNTDKKLNIIIHEEKNTIVD